MSFRPRIMGFLAQPRKVIAVLLVWTLMHVWFLYCGTGGYHAGGFWPFTSVDSFFIFYTPGLNEVTDITFSLRSWELKFYGFSEFFIYVVIPWVAYAVYRLLDSEESAR